MKITVESIREDRHATRRTPVGGDEEHGGRPKAVPLGSRATTHYRFAPMLASGGATIAADRPHSSASTKLSTAWPSVAAGVCL